MKKIFNWSLGSFFRTIGRVFGYLIIGFLIMLIFSKIGFKSFFMPVKAATSGLDRYDYRFWPVSCNLQGENCILGPSSGFLSDKTYYNLTAQYGSIMQFNIRTWAGSYIYKANNTYTFRYTVQVDNKTTLLDNMDKINKSVKLIDMYTATSSSPSNAIQEDINVNIKFTDADGSTDKIYLYIKFSPNRDIKWWGVTFQVGKYGGNYNDFPFSDLQQIRYINAVVTYEEGVGAIIDKKTDEIIKEQEKTNETLNNDNIDESLTKADDFFNGFTTNTHGLTGIITAPLNAIQSLTSKTCTPLVLPIPFVNKNLTLPCMRQIYTDNFGAFMNLYDVIIIGIVSYWVLVRIFTLVKDFKNPDHDEVEVVDL